MDKDVLIYAHLFDYCIVRIGPVNMKVKMHLKHAGKYAAKGNSLALLVIIVLFCLGCRQGVPDRDLNSDTANPSPVMTGELPIDSPYIQVSGEISKVNK
ncbi:MAG: hypothetical protein HQM16_00735 [Deltaproteobacteria bacterium]|nr:hypothetical protein [Deltaproteobacteria bacterium]